MKKFYSKINYMAEVSAKGLNPFYEVKFYN
jgi:hypothetical protein